MASSDPMSKLERQLRELQLHLQELRNETVHKFAPSTAASTSATSTSYLVHRLEAEGVVDGVSPEVYKRYMDALRELPDQTAEEEEVISVHGMEIHRGEPRNIRVAAHQRALSPDQAPPDWMRDVPFFIPRRWRGRLLEEMYGDWMEMAGAGHSRLFVWSAILSQILLMVLSGAWGLLRDLIPSRRAAPGR